MLIVRDVDIMLTTVTMIRSFDNFTLFTVKLFHLKIFLLVTFYFIKKIIKMQDYNADKVLI